MRPGEGRTATKKPGTMVCGKWKIERVIRVTDQLASYEAIDPSGVKVHLKVLHPYKADDASLVARLKREAYVVNRIKHPSMVRVLGDGITDEGSVALALEMVEGDTLEDLRTKRGGTLPADDVIKYALAMCDALQAAHDEQIIHRDVRPDNFVVTKKGELRVPEFGSARVLGESVEARERTAAGATLGSPAFMSPEQARGQRDRVDARSDVFGLGATLYTLVSGKTVHPSDNPLAALLAASRDRAKPVRSALRGPIPDALADAIDKALKFEPTDRYPSMRAFKRGLTKDDAAKAGAGPARSSPSTAPRAAPMGGRPSQAAPPPLPVRGQMGSAPRGFAPSGVPGAPSVAPRPPSGAPPAQSQASAQLAPKASHAVAVAFAFAPTPAELLSPNVPRAPAVPTFGPAPSASHAPAASRQPMVKPELPRSEPSDEVTALMAIPGPGMPHGPGMSPHAPPIQGMRPQQGSSVGMPSHAHGPGQGMSGQGMSPHAMSPHGYGVTPQGQGYGAAQGQAMAPRAPSPSVPDYAGDLPYAKAVSPPFAASQPGSDGMGGAYGPRPSSPGFGQMAGDPNAPYGMQDPQMQGMGAAHGQPHAHAHQAMGYAPQGQGMHGMDAPHHGMGQQGMMGYGTQAMGQQAMMGQGMPGTMDPQGHGMAAHQGMHAGMQGGMDMQAQGASGALGISGSRSAAPDRTLAFVAAGVGLGLIICAVVYALASMGPG